MRQRPPHPTGVGVVGLLAVVLLALPAAADNKAAQKYQIVITHKRGPFPRDSDGKLVIRLSFDVKGTGAAPPVVEDGDRAVIYEDGEPVAEVALGKPRPKNLTVMLALDHSGSMKRPSKSGVSKMKEAKDAARNFIDRLHDKADAGLVLFDDQVELALAPARNAAQLRDHRQQLLARIGSATPRGGTAYLDAVYQSLETLKDDTGKGAVVLMTDGVDLNSRNAEGAVIARAQELKIPVYVIGVGDAGWTKPVSTVLVLDHSKSMERPTGADKKTKIEALHDAGDRFTKLMRAGARVTVLPFSSRVERPQDFTEDKEDIKARINRLRPAGGTSLYDATLAGIETLVAANNPGKKYVVAMTDGVDEDPGSRHDPQEVIDRAKAVGVQLYMLGLGARKEINETVMSKMAEDTGGKFFHAENQQRLTEIFETLSEKIHGDGINEEDLKRLAERTGGQYYAASDASKLKLIFEEVADALRADQTVTFVSRNQRQDGTVSNITIRVKDRAGHDLSDEAGTIAARFGLVVPEVDYVVYLALLGVLVGLLFLPSWLKRSSGQMAGAAARPLNPPVARLVPPRR